MVMDRLVEMMVLFFRSSLSLNAVKQLGGHKGIIQFCSQIIDDEHSSPEYTGTVPSSSSMYP